MVYVVSLVSYSLNFTPLNQIIGHRFSTYRWPPPPEVGGGLWAHCHAKPHRERYLRCQSPPPPGEVPHLGVPACSPVCVWDLDSHLYNAIWPPFFVPFWPYPLARSLSICFLPYRHYCILPYDCLILFTAGSVRRPPAAVVEGWLTSARGLAAPLGAVFHGSRFNTLGPRCRPHPFSILITCVKQETLERGPFIPQRP